MWFCSRCGRECMDKYVCCPDCGTSRPEVKEVLKPWICEKCKKFYVVKSTRLTSPGFEWYQAGLGDKKVEYKRELYTNYCPYCGSVPGEDPTQFSKTAENGKAAKDVSDQGEGMKAADPSALEKNEYITMGLYDQGYGMKPIEWEVIDTNRDGHRLLISRYVLDVKAFHNELKPVSWRESSIRKWLNKEFLKMAFSEEEQNQILRVIPYSYAVPEEKNQRKNKAVPPLQASQDQIFLLSSWEVKDYLSKKKCMADPTVYSIGQGIAGKDGVLYSSLLRANNLRGEGCLWWLRNPGFRDDYACFVNEEGIVDEYGDFCVNNTLGIRPAMWIEGTSEDSKA